MNQPQTIEEGHCPECGAEVRAEARYCWLCGRPLRPGGTAASAGRPMSRKEKGSHLNGTVVSAMSFGLRRKGRGRRCE
jgi:predicted amidophosphoribosyltransferase